MRRAAPTISAPADPTSHALIATCQRREQSSRSRKSFACSRRAAARWTRSRGRRRASPAMSGDVVRYVVNRNINYTNVCYLPLPVLRLLERQDAREPARTAYDLSLEEIVRRAERPGTGGRRKSACRAASIPTTPATPISRPAAREEDPPGLHVHAFSPLEVWQGAATLGFSVLLFLDS